MFDGHIHFNEEIGRRESPEVHKRGQIGLRLELRSWHYRVILDFAIDPEGADPDGRRGGQHRDCGTASHPTGFAARERQLTPIQ